MELCFQAETIMNIVPLVIISVWIEDRPIYLAGVPQSQNQKPETFWNNSSVCSNKMSNTCVKKTKKKQHSYLQKLQTVPCSYAAKKDSLHKAISLNFIIKKKWCFLSIWWCILAVVPVSVSAVLISLTYCTSHEINHRRFASWIRSLWVNKFVWGKFIAGFVVVVVDAVIILQP